MRIVIVEDEQKASTQLLNSVLSLRSKVDCLVIIESVEEGVNWFTNNEHPDLIFMDIQLGDGLSFELFKSIKIECPIIFTTAFDQYAIKAFKVNSLDYLLKPIKTEDLRAALDKFDNSQSRNTNPDVLLSILDKMRNPNSNSSFLVKEGSGFIRLSSESIDYFYSEDSISFAYAKGRRYIIDKTLDQIMEHIDSKQFYRINRGQIVSINSVVKMEPYFNHRMNLKVQGANDKSFIISRTKVGDFKKWVEGG